MATRKTTSAPRKPAARAVTVKPAATSPAVSAVKPPSAGVSTGVGVGSGALPLRPPLERALDSFTRELRAALDRGVAETAALRAELAALRTEVQQLRQRYEAHTHTYERTTMGGGGHQWIELRFLQGYIDAENPGYEKYGIWARGKSTSDLPPEHPTSGPSA